MECPGTEAQRGLRTSPGPCSEGSVGPWGPGGGGEKGAGTQCHHQAKRDSG